MVHAACADVLRPAIDVGGEAATVDEFEGEVREAADLADVVDLDDVGVLEAGEGLGLLVEPRQGDGAGVGAGQDHLERDQTIQADLAGLVDDSHAAPAQLLEDLEAGDDWPPGRSPGSLRGRSRQEVHAGLMTSGPGLKSHRDNPCILIDSFLADIVTRSVQMVLTPLQESG